jgi:hypothetical protein
MHYFDLTILTTREELANHWRSLAKEHHPDSGGDVAVMQEINVQYKDALQALSARLLPAIIPKEKPVKAPKTPKAKAARPKPAPTQKKRAPAKQRASRSASGKRGKTFVDFLADVVILGVEFVRERSRED